MSEIDPQSAIAKSDNSALRREAVAGYMRLHHFLTYIIEDSSPCDDSSLFLAISGKGDEYELARTIRAEAKGWLVDRAGTLQAEPHGDPREYMFINDVIGNWQLAKIVAWRQQTVREMAQLAKLPDSAVLKLGVSKDSICEGCAIGEHCTLKTMARYYAPDEKTQESDFGTVIGEEAALSKLMGYFSMDEYQLEYGTDYLTDYEEYALVDDDGTIDFVQVPYMLVTMGSVRSLIFSTSKQFP